MTNSADLTGASPPDPDVAAGRSKVRFQGIVEADRRAEAARFGGFEAWAASTVEWGDFRKARMARAGAALERWARFVALLVFFSVALGWPIGSWWAHRTLTGSWADWSLARAYSEWAIVFVIIVPPVLIVFAHIAARMMAMIGAAESIAAAAQQFVRPDEAAIGNVQTVGAVVRGEIEQLNAGIDDALIRLASAEAMIRQHVVAIEQAGAAVDAGASNAAGRVAAERARLIDLTETLNARADDFATAIAEKAQANIEALENAGGAASSAETRLDDRLARLEAAAQRALQSFDALSSALAGADEHMRATSGSIENAAGEVKRASAHAAKIADEAADSAARNAANIGSVAGAAAESAKTAANEAVDIARREAERASAAAIEFATREAKRVTEAAAKAVEDVQAATRSAVETAAGDAEKAASAADLVSEAARMATTAARAATDEVKKASEFAKKSADDAIGLSEAASSRVEARNKELAAARASLEAENARLESLIEEQRRRADRLAEAIATQTERLSRLAETQLREQEAAARLAEAQAVIQKSRAAEPAAPPRPEPQTPSRPVQKETEKAQGPDVDPPAARTSNVLELGAAPRRRAATAPQTKAAAPQSDNDRKPPPAGEPGQANGKARDERGKDGVSWREILSATDDAEPLDLGAETKRAEAGRAGAERAATNAIRIIAGLQSFTLDLETRLYGEPPPALFERFERGDRNVFANRLLRLNEADVKRRIRGESARDKTFEKGIHDFLQGFERLLEDATTSETADEELEEYLSSPLGRVYLLVGATVGYFA